ncbi:MAG: molybdopterin converting factor subunit 1 [Alphaproteobacteria bacterium]|nr:molybdopterin converting factor subunit 1 [Alphaproteobacteria bacterium]MYE59518.1 molybdopterin converting factor subunit 1 [Alphaproteobacteria bacterium]
MKILYFAWLRDKAGMSEWQVSPPPGIVTVGALIDWLAAQNASQAEVFADRSVVRVAVNQDFAEADTPVGPGDEVAFFPPVTGG